MTEAELERIAEQRLKAESKETAPPPPPKPSREQWLSYNPGGDYDAAMKERDTAPMDVAPSDEYAEIQAKLLAAQKKLQDQTGKHKVEDSLIGLPVGAAAGYLTTGAGFNPASPSPELIARSSAAPIAEAITGAPTGSVAEIAEAMAPQRSSGYDKAINAASEARNPSVAPLPPSVVKVPPKGGAGQEWLKGWAGIEKEIDGGVPEGAATYNRMKPQGKVTSKLFKKFGMNPQLSIEGYTAAKAGMDAENAMKIRQDLFDAEMRKVAEQNYAKQVAERTAQVQKEATATGRAMKMAAPLATFNRTLAGAGVGLGGYDAYKRYTENDPTGAALAAGTTLAGTAFPPVAPLAGAVMGLYDDPVARKKFLDAMKANGAMSERAGRRFGLD
jgi:hypothetical protein